LTATGHILPDSNEVYDLGSDTKRFRDIYLSGSTIFLGAKTLSEDNLVTTDNAAEQLAGSSIDGDFTVTGKITAQEFHTEFVSASIIYESGSTQFGNSVDDTHEFTGTGSFDKIGIGTSNPSTGLHVKDTNIHLQASNAKIQMSDFGNSMYLRMDNTGSLDITDQNQSPLVSFKQGGNVGIGENTPSQKLEIRSTGDTFALITGASGLTKGGIYLGNDGTQYSSLWFDNASNDLVIRQNYINGNLIFGTNSTEKMRITSDGNVGVGTTAPQSLLHSDEFSQGLSDRGFLKFISTRLGHTAALVMAQITVPADYIYLFVKVSYTISRAPASSMGSALAGEFFCTIARDGSGSDVTITNDIASQSYYAVTASAGGTINIGSSTPNPRAERNGSEANTDPQVVNITFGNRSNNGSFLYNLAAFEIMGTIKKGGISYTYY
jgi:hypothetical protein